MADQAGQEGMLKQIISTYRCGICRQTFQRDLVRVAARHDELWIVSVRCARCRNQQVFWVSMRDRTPEDAWDEAETERDIERAPISSDEQLDLHAFLREFDGDFKSLFGR